MSRQKIMQEIPVRIVAVVRRGNRILLRATPRPPRRLPFPTIPFGRHDDVSAAVHQLSDGRSGLIVEPIRILDARPDKQGTLDIFVECFAVETRSRRKYQYVVSGSRWVPAGAVSSLLKQVQLPLAVNKLLVDIRRSPWRVATVVDCFLMRRGKLAVFRRSNLVGTYRGRWGTVAGHLPSNTEPLEQAFVELREEVRLQPRDVRLRSAVGPVVQVDRTIKRVWVVFAFLFETAKERFTLDWEHDEMRWIPPAAFRRLPHAPGMPDALRALIARSRRLPRRRAIML